MSLNLGKAFDGLFRDRADWVDESGFPQYEEFINATLRGDRAELRLRSSLGELSNQIETTGARFGALLASKRTSVRTHNQMVERLGDVKARLGRLDYQTERSERYFEEFLKLRLAPKLEERMKSVEALCQDLFARFSRETCDDKSGGKSQFRGREVNQFLKVLGAELGNDFSEDIFDLNGALGAQLREELNKLARDTESGTMEMIGSAVDEIGLEFLGHPEDFDLSGLPELSRRPLSLEPFKETKFLLGVIPWPASYPSGAVEGRFRKDLTAEVRSLFEKRLAQWSERLKSRYYRACLETRFLPTMGKIEELISEQLRLVNRAESERMEVETVTDKIQEDLRKMSRWALELDSKTEDVEESKT